MRRVLVVMAMITAALLAVLVTGCSSTVTGHAVRAGQAGLPLTDDGFGVVLGAAQDGGAAAIDLFIEPHCPHCGHFVAQYGDAIAKDLTANRLSITIRPLTFLDSGRDDYSARATNAIFLMAEGSKATPIMVWSFIEGIYRKLLSTGMTLDDDAIAQVANDVGADPSTVNAVAAGLPAVEAADVNDGNLSKMDEYGVEPATPAVYDTVKKDAVDFTDPHWLDRLVR